MDLKLPNERLHLAGFDDPYLFPLRRVARPALRLFCFPYAGGSAGVFRNWPRGLDPRIDIVAIQLPGRGVRAGEAPITDFPWLVEEVGAAVAATGSRVPFVFYGHSLGALLAFEVCRRARRLGLRRPAMLFASGRQAPHCPVRRRPVAQIDDDEFLAELRTLKGTPPTVLDNAELMQFLLPLIRADFALLDSWRFEHDEPLDLPIVIMNGRADEHAAPEGAAQWARWTRAGSEMLSYEGGHFFLQEQERAVVRDVAERLAACLGA